MKVSTMFFELIDSDVELLTDFDEHNRYCVHLSKNYSNWEYRLMDFIRYHEAIKVNVEYSVNDADMKHAITVYMDSSFDGTLRSYEDNVLVHTTTSSSWKTIKSSMKIKSWNLATKDKELNEIEPIGEQLRDPKRFRDFVMLGKMSYHNEIIVLSKQLGKLVFDKDHPYVPGVRLYIDAEKLARDGLLIRDGLHLKVKDFIQLDRYMLDYVDPSQLDIDEFTPYTFATLSDELFRNRNKDNVI